MTPSVCPGSTRPSRKQMLGGVWGARGRGGSGFVGDTPGEGSRQQSWAGGGPWGCLGKAPLAPEPRARLCPRAHCPPPRGALSDKPLRVFPGGSRGLGVLFRYSAHPWWDDSNSSPFWLSCLYLKLSPSLKFLFQTVCCFRGDLPCVWLCWGLWRLPPSTVFLGAQRGKAPPVRMRLC